MSSLLAQVLGQGKAEKKAVIEEATKNATDLSGLVRKKPKAEAKTEPSNGTTASNGKRKLGDDAEDSDSKKTRVDA
jgi:HAT1-interacting factor 1